jgi:hypothetical protein
MAVVSFGDGFLSAAKAAYDVLRDTPEGFMYELTPGWELDSSGQGGWVTITRTGTYNGRRHRAI